ncbi:unnamed protein product [Coffea canephora]|uniref:Uncharacterized protein n=1 Tax=Coffea canephora TaxID=49390 RepID=A0A068TWC0_COFCA|nr:unnamed protein product [Coffea canephora]
MQFKSLVFLHLFLLQCLSYICLVQSHDFFFVVQMWPGSYCDTKRVSCCYRAAGKPTDFTIHGLWPHFNNNSIPQDCNRKNPFNKAKVSDLTTKLEKTWPTFKCGRKSSSAKFWSHEWTKHGTCSEDVLDQHAYFKAALNIKDKVNLLEILKNAGIQPDGKFYKLDDIKEAIKAGTGYNPVIECNTDASGNIQLYQVYLCVDSAGSSLIECPVTLKRDTSIELPML